MGAQALIAAIVVLYHPEADRLHDLYRSIQPQVDAVWLIDNTPGSTGQQFPPLHSGELPWPVQYRPLGDNHGIAVAQNVGLREVLAQGYEQMLLLDQDSLLPDGTIRRLLEAQDRLLEQGRAVAAVGPVFVDRKTGLPGRTHRHRWFRLQKLRVDLASAVPVETDWLIASGSLMRRSVLEQVGPMREELFIDAVDMEWGLRARSLGLQSFVVPNAPIAHSVGDSFAKLFGSSVILHGELRNYYITRNWLYLLQVRTMGARWRSGALPHLGKFLLAHLWLASDRGRMARVFGRALLDAAQARMGRYRGVRKPTV